jgi:hypothetical protein
MRLNRLSEEQLRELDELYAGRRGDPRAQTTRAPAAWAPIATMSHRDGKQGCTVDHGGADSCHGARMGKERPPMTTSPMLPRERCNFSATSTSRR